MTASPTSSSMPGWRRPRSPTTRRWSTAIAAFFGTDADALRQSPLALVGSPGDIAEMLHERRERWGYSYHVIPGDKARDFAPIVADSDRSGWRGEVTVGRLARSYARPGVDRPPCG